MGYVELSARTGFSFGDGAATPEAVAVRAKHLGYDALGITDAADLGGVVRFAAEAAVVEKHSRCPAAASHTDEPCPRCERELRPIVGAELQVDGHPLTLLVRDAQGLRNLAGLITRSRVGGWDHWDQAVQRKRRGRPTLTWEQVAERASGLQLLTGPASGRLGTLLRAGKSEEAERQLGHWRQAFEDRIAVEVQMHHAGGAEASLARAGIALAEEQQVPWVVTHAPRYLDSAGRLIHDIQTALRNDMDLETAAARGVLHPNGEWRLISPAQMARRWRGCEAGLRESERIAGECDFSLLWMRPPLPRFKPPSDGSLPDVNDDHEALRAATFAGARERWGESLTDQQRNQLEHELSLIGRLGFAGFFLVMWDAVRFARTRGILCQGRGSAANSAVAYCLGITAVDPVLHGLLFERFLSEVRMDGRAEAPDIDVDIEHDRREEVLDYVYGAYQRSHAAITCTVQTYRGPNAVLDSMRALGYPPSLATMISKRLHYSEPVFAAERLKDEIADRVGLDVSDARGQTLLAAIAAFEGLPRMRSTHVGGFVLSAGPLGDYVPIEQTAMGRTIVQFDKDDLDAVGIPKFDFLGLGALALVRRSFDAVERRTGKRPAIYHLPPDDKKTYDLIARGETIGMFQIESRAQIASIVHTKPDRLYDIVVQVALIRPGPIQAKFVHPYTQRRRGEAPVTCVHPGLEPILKRTQGIPIFQEQAMAIAMALAGYTGSEADELRRTMGNIRKQDRLTRALSRLSGRMVAKGIEEPVAVRICEDLASFANYGFPESHAWSFALIAYATAYLKAHYPTEFYLGLLNAWPMGFYAPATLIHDAKRHGVEVRPACLRHGDWECTAEWVDPAEQPALRIGWRHIRGAGTQLLDRLRAAHALGRFTSIADVVDRSCLTRAEALSLARADAFGAWEADRRRAAWEALRAVGDILPLAPAHPTTHDPAPMSRTDLIFLDYASTGVSIHGHPMEAARERLRAAKVLDSRDLESIDDGRQVVVAGLVTVRQRPATANGTIFLLLEDEHGFMNVIVPSQLVEPNEEVVKQAQFILVLGRFERDGGVLNVVGRKFKALQVREIVHRSHDFR